MPAMLSGADAQISISLQGADRVSKTLQEHSRDDHRPNYSGPPTYQEIQVGALLRIAEALEKMALYGLDGEAIKNIEKNWADGAARPCAKEVAK